jgi:hypothetical protein
MAKPLALTNHITTIEQRMCQKRVGTQGEGKKETFYPEIPIG